jgi:hypothetical protein
MLTIQRNYWKDLESAKAKIEFAKGKNPTKVELYRAIASYLGCNVDGLELDQLWAAIDERNQDLACVDVEAAKIEFRKPVLRPIKPVQRPRIGGLEVAIMRPKRVEKPKLKSYS